MYLIDTDILINLSRGSLDKKILKWDGSESISDITYMEFVQGCRNMQELNLWKRVCRRLRLIPLSEEVSHRARYLIEAYALSHRMTLGDALIASTALHHDLMLITGNRKHYRYIPGLKARFI